MLIKVGKYRINLAHVVFIEMDESVNVAIVEMVGSERIHLKDDSAADFLAAWDKWAQFQNDAQEINEFAVAENLKQIKQAQNKSGIIAPKMTMPRGARG